MTPAANDFSRLSYVCATPEGYPVTLTIQLPRGASRSSTFPSAAPVVFAKCADPRWTHRCLQAGGRFVYPELEQWNFPQTSLLQTLVDVSIGAHCLTGP